MSSIPKKPLQKPTCIPMKFTSVEDMFKWFASHKPSRKDIYIESRTFIITFSGGPTRCSIQPWYDGNEAGFLIYYYINNELDSQKIHLFEKEKFFQYLKEYFLTPAEYEQWMKQLEKDIGKSKRLKQLHDSGTCAGANRCRYCTRTDET